MLNSNANKTRTRLLLIIDNEIRIHRKEDKKNSIQPEERSIEITFDEQFSSSQIEVTNESINNDNTTPLLENREEKISYSRSQYQSPEKKHQFKQSISLDDKTIESDKAYLKNHIKTFLSPIRKFNKNYHKLNRVVSPGVHLLSLREGD